MVWVYWAEILEGDKGLREQSKWARRLLEQALKSQYSKICKPVLLEKDLKGKPFLAEYPEIHINLSHSGAYVACAIGDKPVGVDIECRKKRSGQELVVKKFHAKEQKLYHGAAEEQRELLFRELWVLKESFMKAEGSGLRITLDSFYIEDIGHTTGRVIQSQNNKSYYYKLYHIRDKEFSLGACSEETDFLDKPIEVLL